MNQFHSRVLIGFFLLIGLRLLESQVLDTRCIAVLLFVPLIYDLLYLKGFLMKSPGSFLIFSLISIYGILGTLSLIIFYHNSHIRKTGFLLVTTVSTSDIFQYLFGRFLFSTPKPFRISPQKSLGGYFFGFLATLSLFVWFLHYEFLEIFLWILMGCLGDLLVSFLKRQLGIKDISNLLGSHGGWIDRLDGIFLTSFFQLLNFYLLSYVYKAS